MFKQKYKIKKKKKIVSPYKIFFIFVIILIFTTYAYALFSDNLILNIKANILASGIKNGKSTYYWKLVNSWGGSSANSTMYQLQFLVDYKDDDASTWEINMDIPDGLVIKNCKCWQASSMTLSGNTLTLIANSWNGSISTGSSFDLTLQLEFQGKPGISNAKKPQEVFSNFIFNRLKLKYYDPNNPNITDDDSTNTIKSNTTGGNTTTGEDVTDPSEVETGKSTYNWSQTSSWGQNPVVYASTLNIVNNDSNYYDHFEISFDVPDGFLVEASGNCNVWQADTVTKSGNTITIKSKSGTVWWSGGQTLTLYLQLRFEESVDFSISNLVVNGKKAIEQ